MTNVLGAKKDRTSVISRKEFDRALTSAKTMECNPYYGLRDCAILCLLWLTGKRAGEVAQLELDDVVVEAGLLRVTFTVLKKRNRDRLGLRRTKDIPLSNPYTEPIITYHDYMVANHIDCRYFFPSTRYSNFTGQVIVAVDSHLHRVSVWRRVTLHGPGTWTHLYRETQGAMVVRAQGNQIAGLFAVKQRLDLEDLNTAMRYVQRYGSDLIEEDRI